MKESFSSLISPDLRVIATPLGILVALAILSFISYRIAYSKISTQREEVAVAKETEKVLSDKQKVLTQVDANIGSYVNSVAASVPEKNPVLMMISQLKSLAGTRSITINNLKGGSEVNSQESIPVVALDFEVGGSLDSVLDFLKSFETVAPLSTIDQLKIAQSAGNAQTEVSLKLYFSPFPQKFPALTEPITELTADEKELLAKLQQLKLPSFVNLAPQTPSLRTTPFD